MSGASPGGFVERVRGIGSGLKVVVGSGGVAPDGVGDAGKEGWVL